MIDCLYLIPNHEGTINQVGLYLVGAQGLLNSIAMNEKLVHGAIVMFCHRKISLLPQVPPEIPISRYVGKENK
jgi:hypothetical protein